MDSRNRRLTASSRHRDDAKDTGELAAGAALIDEWRSWRAPAIDMFGPMPFSEADRISNDSVDPLPFLGTTEWFDALPDAAIDAIVAATEPASGPPALLDPDRRFRHGFAI